MLKKDSIKININQNNNDNNNNLYYIPSFLQTF